MNKLYKVYFVVKYFKMCTNPQLRCIYLPPHHHPPPHPPPPHHHSPPPHHHPHPPIIPLDGMHMEDYRSAARSYPAVDRHHPHVGGEQRQFNLPR